jgi:hypothetical protein
MSCAQTATIPTNNTIEASAAASSTNNLNMISPPERKENIVYVLF